MGVADNKAICLAFAGYLLALMFIFNGATTDELDGGKNYADYSYEDQTMDAIVVLIFLLLGQLLLALSQVINDTFVLYGKDNDLDMLEGVADLQRSVSAGGTQYEKFSAVGVVEGASFVASGMIIGAAQYGYVDLDEPAGWGMALGTMVFYWMLGQVALIVFFHADCLMISMLRDVINPETGEKSSVIQAAQGDNHPLAIRIATDMLAVGCCISAPLHISDSLITWVSFQGFTFA